MTPEEVEDYIKALRVKTSDGYYADTLDSIYNAMWAGELNKNNSVFEVVDKQSEDGDSYSSESRKMVIKFGDQLFQKTGYFDSWGDSDSWDGALVEVVPEQVVTIHYREKSRIITERFN